MTETELEQLAARVADKLRTDTVIAATLPAYIGQAIKDAAAGGALWWHQSIPLQGAHSLAARWRLQPDGTLHQEITDWSGQIVWQGTFRPAASP